MHYSQSCLQLQEVFRKKAKFVEISQNSVDSDAVNSQKPRKSKNRGCQDSGGVNAHIQVHPHPPQHRIDEIHRDGPQNPPHDQIQDFFHVRPPGLPAAAPLYSLLSFGRQFLRIWICPFFPKYAGK